MSDYPTVDALVNDEFTVYAERSSRCWDSAGNPQLYYELAAMLKQIAAQKKQLITQGRLLEGQHQQIARLKQTAGKGQEQKRKLQFESPQERCRRTRLQNCHFCDSVDCCDNSSPLKKQVKALRRKVEELRETLEWAGLKELQ